MAGSGTGFPLNFRCWRCRRAATFLPERLRYWQGYDVELTGRKRKGKSSYCRRADQYKRQYRCPDCGHVGWSNHVDLKHKERHGETQKPV